MSQTRPLVGFMWMVVSGGLFVGVTAIVKYVGSEVPASEAAFLRYAIGLVFLLPFARSLWRTRLPRSLLRLFAVRGAFHTLGVLLWFFAMTQIPLVEVTALSYISPICVMIGAVLFLGERFVARRAVAIVLSLVGVLLILQPGARAVEPGHLAMLGTALLFSVSLLIAKRTTDVASPAVVVAMLSVCVTIGLAPFAAVVWVTPGLTEVFWFGLAGAFATAGHFTMTLAFRAAPVTLTQPATFLQLVWASVLGWSAFGEVPDIWVLAGGTVIVASVSYAAWRDAAEGRAR